MKPRNVPPMVGLDLRSIGDQVGAHQLRHRFATKVYRGTHLIRLTQESLGLVVGGDSDRRRSDMTKATLVLGPHRATFP
jgi:hypothetical protein